MARRRALSRSINALRPSWTKAVSSLNPVRLRACWSNSASILSVVRKAVTLRIAGELELAFSDMGREKFREEVSDHLPFVASFRIDRDLV